MEAMLTLMTALKNAGYTEETDYYKAVLTSPDKEITVRIDAIGGVHNVTLSKGMDKNSKTVNFANIRTEDDAKEILSFL